ncbi:MAG: 6-phosphofructokinase [Thiolinea sp.]
MKKIGIITSGGDCGGLNAIIKGSTLAARQQGIQCYVIPNGYAGLYNLQHFSQLVELNEQRLEAFDAGLAGSGSRAFARQYPQSGRCRQVQPHP